MSHVQVTQTVAGTTSSTSTVTRVEATSVVRVSEVGGPSGSSGTSFTYNQPSAGTTWTVNHNLGYRPSVSVYSTGGHEVDAEVLHISVNQVLITFTEPFAGTARFV